MNEEFAECARCKKQFDTSKSGYFCDLDLLATLYDVVTYAPEYDQEWVCDDCAEYVLQDADDQPDVPNAPAASDGDEAATAYTEALRGQIQAALQGEARALIERDAARADWITARAANIANQQQAQATLDAAQQQVAALLAALARFREVFAYAPDGARVCVTCGRISLPEAVGIARHTDDCAIGRAAALLAGEAAPETGATGGEPPIYEADRDALRAMNTNPDEDTYVITFGALRAIFTDLERAAQ